MFSLLSSSKNLVQQLKQVSPKYNGKESINKLLRVDATLSGGQFQIMCGPVVGKIDNLCTYINKEWSEEELKFREKAERENSWVPVYRHKGLLRFFIILRMNSLMFYGSYIFLFYSICQQLLATGLCDLLLLTPQIKLTLLATIVNFLVKRELTRVVGVISVDKESRTIYRIGHFSKYGSRQNKFARLGDLKDLTNSNSTGVGYYSKICWNFRPKEFLLISTTGCEILDSQAAYLLFGSLDHFKHLPETKAVSEETKGFIDEEYRKRLGVSNKQNGL